MSDGSYEHWYAVLDGQKPDITNEPQPGFYRLKDGKPVAIWIDDEYGLQLTVSGAAIMGEGQEEIWLRCAMNAVEEDDYNAVIDGGVWPDMDEAIVETIGHNIRDAKSADDINNLIDSLRFAAVKYETITDDLMAERAQSLRSRTLELTKKADEIRTDEKKPHLEAGRKVDATWQPIVKKGESVANGLRAAMSAYETKKLAEKRALEATQAQAPSNEQPLQQDAPSNIKGGYGRAASKQLKRKVTSINDLDKAVAWMKGMDRQLLITFLCEQAQKAVNAGFVAPDGFDLEDVVDIR